MTVIREHMGGVKESLHNFEISNLPPTPLARMADWIDIESFWLSGAEFDDHPTAMRVWFDCLRTAGSGAIDTNRDVSIEDCTKEFMTMLITTPPLTSFQTNFSAYGKVGFHGTSILAAKEIEQVGLLPNKIFPTAVHDEAIDLANRYGIDVGWYVGWLEMKSVSFGMVASVAIAQMNNGFIGGQGLDNMEKLLTKIVPLGTAQEVAFAQKYLRKIADIRASQAVIYAVNLTGLGPRVIPDGAEVSHVYFNPAAPLPTISDVQPSMLIERLSL